MTDPDFEDGFQKGKRAARKGAGWVAGLAADAVGPTIERAGDSLDRMLEKKNAELQSQRLIAHQQQIHLEQQRVLAHESRAVILQQNISQSQNHRTAKRVYVIVVPMYGLEFAVLGSLADTGYGLAWMIGGCFFGLAVIRFASKADLHHARFNLMSHNDPSVKESSVYKIIWLTIGLISIAPFAISFLRL